VVAPSSVPGELEISARTEEGTIMGCRMRGRPVEGVLFHPESFLTEQGSLIFKNFLNVV
jgi:anthranilate/para-aminobenzoate synthase component II